MWIEFEAWHLWIILGLLLAALEMLGLGFVALAIGVACIGGAAAALADQPLWIQIATTAVAAAILTPLFVRYFRTMSGARDRVAVTGETGSHGQQAVIVWRQQRAGVVLKGDFFPAQLVQPAASPELKEGQRVEIIEFSGITAMVRVIEGAVEVGDQSQGDK